jgi:arylsulfatase A-like enzyme
MGVFQWGYPMRPQEITLAEALKTVGYATGHFGKWHLGSVRRESPANPGANGFDAWLSAPNFYDNDPVLSREGTAVQMQGESSIVAADAALEFMAQQAKAEKPFLAVVWFGSPHNPHRAVQQDRQLYDDQPQKVQDFYGEITGMDRAFGKIRQGITDLGVRENTILWYCSDNGALPGLGSTGGHRGHKGDVYEGGLLVPAILEWPAKLSKPQVSEMRATTCDIYPTLLAIAGVTMPNQPQLDGMSLLPLIEGNMQTRPKPQGFWDHAKGGISTPSAAWMGELLKAQQAGSDLPPHVSSQKAAELPSPPHATDSFPGHSAWIEGDWKLHRIENKKGNVRWELYDLSNDAAEEHDLSKQQPERMSGMKKSLGQWLVSVVESLNGEDYQ